MIIFENTEAKIVKRQSDGQVLAFLASGLVERIQDPEGFPQFRNMEGRLVSVPSGEYCNLHWACFDGLLLPRGSVWIERPPPNGNRVDRIAFCSNVVHELEHAKGGNELEACLRQRIYLRRNGFQGPSDKQIYRALCGTYPKAEALNAEEYAYGTRTMGLHGVLSRHFSALRNAVCRWTLRREVELQDGIPTTGTGAVLSRCFSALRNVVYRWSLQHDQR